MSFDLSGTWQVNDGSSTYHVQLTQQQSHVVGLYDFPPGHHGHIDGFVQGDGFTFRWDQPSNQRAGSGDLYIAEDGHTMSGSWSYDPSAYNSGLVGSGRWTFRREGIDPVLARFHNWLNARLAANGYVPVGTVAPVQWAFLRPAGGLYDPRLIAVVDGRQLAEAPSTTFERIRDWFQRTRGGGMRGGEGLLLFVYSAPTATLIEELKASRFYAGNGAVEAGAYDLATGKHWLSYSGSWETDIFAS